MGSLKQHLLEQTRASSMNPITCARVTVTIHCVAIFKYIAKYYVVLQCLRARVLSDKLASCGWRADRTVNASTNEITWYPMMHGCINANPTRTEYSLHRKQRLNRKLVVIVGSLDQYKSSNSDACLCVKRYGILKSIIASRSRITERHFFEHERSSALLHDTISVMNRMDITRIQIEAML